jgi:hypothetical protein
MTPLWAPAIPHKCHLVSNCESHELSYQLSKWGWIKIVLVSIYEHKILTLIMFLVVVLNNMSSHIVVKCRCQIKPPRNHVSLTFLTHGLGFMAPVLGGPIKHGPCRCGNWDTKEFELYIFQTPRVEYFIVISSFKISNIENYNWAFWKSCEFLHISLGGVGEENEIPRCGNSLFVKPGVTTYHELYNAITFLFECKVFVCDFWKPHKTFYVLESLYYQIVLVETRG